MSNIKENDLSNNSNKINSFIINNNEQNPSTNNYSFIPPKKKNLKKFSFKSQAGKNENGLTKMNQDNFLIMENILNNEEFKIYGVFDGHGKK